MRSVQLLQFLHHSAEIHARLALAVVVLAIVLLEGLLIHPWSHKELSRVNNVLRKLVFGPVLLYVIGDRLYLLWLQKVGLSFLQFQVVGYFL